MEAARVVAWTSEPALAVAADGRIVALNAACEALLGRTPEEGEVLSCADLVNSGVLGCRCDAAACGALHSMSSGAVIDLRHCELRELGPEGIPLAVAAVTIPPEERADGAVAVILLQEASRPRPLETGLGRWTWAPRDLPAHPDVRLRLLGRPEVEREGVSQNVRRRRSLELLALLTFGGATGLTRDWVSAQLWPDAPRGNGRAHLRVLLHDIRHTLSEHAVEVVLDAGGAETAIRLGRDVWTDVDAFQRAVRRGQRLRAEPALPAERRERLGELREAIECYRQDLDATGEFGPWVATHRECLRSQLLSLITEAAELAASLGLVEDVIAYCRRAVEVDPLDESFRIALINTYGHLGRPAHARAEYEAYQRMLVQELSLRPSASIERALRCALQGRED